MDANISFVGDVTVQPSIHLAIHEAQRIGSGD